MLQKIALILKGRLVLTPKYIFVLSLFTFCFFKKILYILPFSHNICSNHVSKQTRLAQLVERRTFNRLINVILWPRVRAPHRVTKVFLFAFYFLHFISIFLHFIFIFTLYILPISQTPLSAIRPHHVCPNGFCPNGLWSRRNNRRSQNYMCRHFRNELTSWVRFRASCTGCLQQKQTKNQNHYEINWS